MHMVINLMIVYNRAEQHIRSKKTDLKLNTKLNLLYKNGKNQGRHLFQKIKLLLKHMKKKSGPFLKVIEKMQVMNKIWLKKHC